MQYYRHFVEFSLSENVLRPLRHEFVLLRGRRDERLEGESGGEGLGVEEEGSRRSEAEAVEESLYFVGKSGKKCVDDFFKKNFHAAAGPQQQKTKLPYHHHYPVSPSSSFLLNTTAATAAPLSEGTSQSNQENYFIYPTLSSSSPSSCLHPTASATSRARGLPDLPGRRIRSWTGDLETRK